MYFFSNNTIIKLLTIFTINPFKPFAELDLVQYNDTIVCIGGKNGKI